jgi:capsular exopolysaccharide synthesis family protein
MEAHFSDEATLQADLRQYISLLWRWAWLILLATILAGGAAYITSQLQDPVFQATTTLLINEATSSAQTSDYTAILTSERLARTYSEMLTKRPVLTEVVEILGLEEEYGDLKALQEVITVQLVRDTQLIELSVEDTDAEQAAEIANIVVKVFAHQNQELQASRYAESKASLEGQLTRLDGQIHNAVTELDSLGGDPQDENEVARLEVELVQYRQTYSQLLQSYEQIRVAEAQATSNVVQVEPAIVPEEPIRPRVLMNTALAAVVGGMLAVGAIFLMEALDDTIKSPDDVTRHLNLPILGTILRYENKNDNLITLDEPRSPIAESFRSLRTNIQYTSVDFPIRTLLVTSPTADVGKSTISSNLGVVLAQGGKRTIIVDADMRRPTLHRIFKLPNRLGLSSLFVFQSLFDKSKDLPDGTLQSIKADGLMVVTSGKTPPNPSELLASERMNGLIERFQDEAELVIIDSPPILAVTDATVLAPRVDGVLMVIKPGETKLETARQTVEQLRRVGANLLGVVINEVDPRSGRYGYHYRYDQHYYESTDIKTGIEPRKGLLRENLPRVVVAGIAALVILAGSWFAYSFLTGKRAMDLFAGRPTAVLTQTPFAQAALATEIDMTEIADPTATLQPTDGIETPDDVGEGTQVQTAEPTDDEIIQSTNVPTSVPTSVPTYTPTSLPPTPGPGLGTPFGAQGEYLLHQVNFGDNLPNLSEVYQTDRDVIVAANGLLPNQSLQPDQVILIMPGRTDSFDIVYMVVLFQDTDISVQELAARHGVSDEEMRRYNDLGPGDTIPGGRWIIIPKRDVTPTVTPTVVPTADFSYALTEPFGPNNTYILHQVQSGDSIPKLEKLYLTTADAIYAANDIEGSIQLGSVLVVFPDRRDARGITQFAVQFISADIYVEALAEELDAQAADIIFHNGLQAEEIIQAGSWIIYPAPPADE